MNYRNYEYIVASLPVLEPDDRNISPEQADGIIAEIRENLSGRDNERLQLLIDSFDSSALDAGFYDRALASDSRFIREYFRFDLALRNAKTEFLNSELGRESGMDMIIRGEEEYEFDEEARADEIFHDGDILRRERNLDELVWDKIDELVCMEVFTLDFILSCVAKLKIIERWTALDPQTGREMFRKLVDEIRKTR